MLTLILTSISDFHIRLSYDRDSLNFSMMGSTSPVKRPPHSLAPLKEGVYKNKSS